MSPRLKAFKSINLNSYPEDAGSTEGWHEILDKMILAFDLTIKDNHGILSAEEDEAIIEGLALFAKYYRALWD